MRTFSILFFCGVAMFSLSAATAHGVQVDGDTNAAPKASFKEKLSTFHGKLKQRIDSLRGIETRDDRAAQSQQDAPVDHFHFDQRQMQAGAGTRQRQRYADQSQRGYPQQTRPQYQPQKIAQTSYVERRLGSPEPQQDYDPRVDHRNQYQPVQVINAPRFPVGVPVNEPMSSTTYSMPNQGRPTNGARPNALRGEYDQPFQTQQSANYGQFSDSSAQPAIQQQMAHPSMTATNQMHATGGQQRMGHFQNGFSRVQTLTDQQQVTASARVLQLQAQNEQLVAQIKAIQAESKRLNDIISENQKMLGRAEVSIGSSLEQLRAANQKNESLKQQIVRLQAESKMQKAESKRMLDSIRQRLDDVLIREISSN